jgi:integrase
MPAAPHRARPAEGLVWQVREAIADALVGCPAHERVFAGPGGNGHARRGERTALSVNNYRRVYKRVVDRAAGLAHLDLHGPHDLRHTYAAWLEEAGIPSRVIDELMGHSGVP